MKAAKQIGYRDFVDDTRRAVFEDDIGQFVLDDDGTRLYGLWLVSKASMPRLNLRFVALLLLWCAVWWAMWYVCCNRHGEMRSTELIE